MMIHHFMAQKVGRSVETEKEKCACSFGFFFSFPSRVVFGALATFQYKVAYLDLGYKILRNKRQQSEE